MITPEEKKLLDDINSLLNSYKSYITPEEKKLLDDINSLLNSYKSYAKVSKPMMGIEKQSNTSLMKDEPKKECYGNL
jgi:DNA replication initiation complex subunit (GINS family)